MKKLLRQQYKQIRQNLSSEEVKLYSEQIAKQLFQTALWHNSQTVMLYLSFQNEVATDRIYHQGWCDGKTMLTPICLEQNGCMEMSILSSFSQLERNRYGIAELPKQLQKIIPAQDIDLCLIPGVAFDLAGNRLGFGAGYYDRYLIKIRPQVKRMALAYECQLHLSGLPKDTHDLPMDYILTEKQLYRMISL